ncbi:MerR family transcriptional regulator [bacterium]|nr:MAG: MerR family transcriptional regulator [bacterium]
MTYTVKSVSEIAGISIRTLHYYDQIDLFKPEAVSESGYRLYSDHNLERLQEILFFRELGFDLKEIKNILDSPEYDREEALLSHKTLLIEKKRRIEKLIISVEKTLNSIKGVKTMTKKEMFAGFDDKQMEEYKKEAKAIWPQKFAESEKKMANYTKDDMQNIQVEMENIRDQVAALMDKGADNPEVQKVITEYYQYINDKFYSCSPEMFKGLGQMYVDDERFKAYYENAKVGLAEFMKDAMQIYADKISS